MFPRIFRVKNPGLILLVVSREERSVREFRRSVNVEEVAGRIGLYTKFTDMYVFYVQILDAK